MEQWREIIADSVDFHRVVPGLLRLLDFDGAELWAMDQSCGRIRMCAHNVKDDGVFQYERYSTYYDFARGQGLVGRVFLSGSSEWQPDVSKTDREVFHRFAGAKMHGIKGVAGIACNFQTGEKCVICLVSQDVLFVSQDRRTLVENMIRRWIANSDGESESKLPPYGIGVFTSNNNTAAVVGKSSPSPSPSSSFMLTRTTNSNNVSSRVSALAANILSPTPTITMGIPSSAAAGASLPPPSLLPHLSSSSSSSLSYKQRPSLPLPSSLNLQQCVSSSSSSLIPGVTALKYKTLSQLSQSSIVHNQNEQTAIFGSWIFEGKSTDPVHHMKLKLMELFLSSMGVSK
mmetsp:Transcript_26343/g.44137  ORF Transcript_26343/g.44137 Transcript_26343/m.44137 type:complete len:344 (-) Transcript_26343:300-1331(-)